MTDKTPATTMQIDIKLEPPRAPNFAFFKTVDQMLGDQRHKVPIRKLNSEQRDELTRLFRAELDRIAERQEKLGTDGPWRERSTTNTDMEA